MAKDKISIIWTHWNMSVDRVSIAARSLDSLIKTTQHLPVEIIVIENGNRIFADERRIQFYVSNSENLYFGHARNQGLDIACGEYVVISDNDIEYKEGWLDKSVALLKEFSDKKVAVTPLKADRIHRQEKYWSEWFELNGEKFPANKKAGSNCWVMRRKDFDVVGKFRNHHIAGSKWTDRFVNCGYTMITMETDPLALDLGFKRGYNIKMKATIKRKFANGEELVIND